MIAVRFLGGLGCAPGQGSRRIDGLWFDYGPDRQAEYFASHRKHDLDEGPRLEDTGDPPPSTEGQP